MQHRLYDSRVYNSIWLSILPTLHYIGMSDSCRKDDASPNAPSLLTSESYPTVDCCFLFRGPLCKYQRRPTCAPISTLHWRVGWIYIYIEYFIMYNYSTLYQHVIRWGRSLCTYFLYTRCGFRLANRQAHLTIVRLSTVPYVSFLLYWTCLSKNTLL